MAPGSTAISAAIDYLIMSSFPVLCLQAALFDDLYRISQSQLAPLDCSTAKKSSRSSESMPRSRSIRAETLNDPERHSTRFSKSLAGRNDRPTSQRNGASQALRSHQEQCRRCRCQGFPLHTCAAPQAVDLHRRLDGLFHVGVDFDGGGVGLAVHPLIETGALEAPAIAEFEGGDEAF